MVVGRFCVVNYTVSWVAGGLGNVVGAIPWASEGPRDVYFTRIFVSVCFGVGEGEHMRNGGWAVLCRKLHGFVGRGGPVELGVGLVWDWCGPSPGPRDLYFTRIFGSSALCRGLGAEEPSWRRAILSRKLHVSVASGRVAEGVPGGGGPSDAHGGGYSLYFY